MSTILGKLFGKAGKTVIDSVGSVLDNLITNKEELAAAKLEAEKEINRHLEALGAEANKELELRLHEVQNARQREIEYVKALGHVDWMQIAVGVIVMLSFGFLQYVLVYRNLPDANREVFMHLMGMIDTAAGLVIGYYFGSSKGSADKTKMMK
jgi:vacuolar-type H+-ATPase subunit I/STV1